MRVDTSNINLPLGSPSNPAWVFNWVPPSTGQSLYAFLLVNICAFCIIFHDILIHSKFSYHMWKGVYEDRKTTIRHAGIWYSFTRSMCLGANMIGVIFFAARDHVNCRVAWIVFGVLYALANAGNSLVLGLRVIALCRYNRFIVTLLSLLWIIVLAFDTSVAWAAGGRALLYDGVQMGCVPADPLPINGVNFNISAQAATLGYDLICAAFVIYRLRSSIVSSDSLTPYLRKQTIFLYSMIGASSLTFIIVSSNPGQHIDPVASVIFANPYIAFQTIVVGYIFRDLQSFVRKQSQTGVRASAQHDQDPEAAFQQVTGSDFRKDPSGGQFSNITTSSDLTKHVSVRSSNSTNPERTNSMHKDWNASQSPSNVMEMAYFHQGNNNSSSTASPASASASLSGWTRQPLQDSPSVALDDKNTLENI